jgi:hypothetical protein
MTLSLLSLLTDVMSVSVSILSSTKIEQSLLLNQESKEQTNMQLSVYQLLELGLIPHLSLTAGLVKDTSDTEVRTCK